MALDKQSKQQWNGGKSSAMERLTNEAVQSYSLPEEKDNPARVLFSKGLGRAIDEKFAKEDQKENAIQNGIDLSLSDVVAGSRSEKQELVAELATLTGLPESVFKGSKTEELRQALAAKKSE